MAQRGLDLSDSGKGQGADPCEHDKEASGYTKCG